MVAVSPITKIWDAPGSERASSTLTRPTLSASALSQVAAGDAFTPAAQTTFSASNRLAPAVTPDPSHSVTGRFLSTSTPTFSSYSYPPYPTPSPNPATTPDHTPP